MTKAANLTGTFVHDGIKITLEKIDPRPDAYKGTKERGLRVIRIDEEIRGYIVFPHGWGKYPVVQDLEQFASGRLSDSGVKTIFGNSKSEYYSLITAQIIVDDLVKTNKLPSRGEIDAEKAKKEAEQKKLTDEREARMKEWIADGIDTVQKMMALRDKLADRLTEEEKELLRKVNVKILGAYHSDVKKHFADTVI